VLCTPLCFGFFAKKKQQKELAFLHYAKPMLKAIQHPANAKLIASLS
jgi:hypothetical protein